MSASILAFPERHLKPNYALALEAIKETGGEPGALLQSALDAFEIIKRLQDMNRGAESVEPRVLQSVVDCWGVISLAVGAALGTMSIDEMLEAAEGISAPA